MNMPCEYRRISRLTIACTLFANCLLVWGCPQQAPSTPPQTGKHAPTTYPAVVFDVPYRYCQPSKERKDQKCESSKDLYLNLVFLEDSKSVLWDDINDVMKKSKFWKLNVFRASTGEYVVGTIQEDPDKKTDWLPTSRKDIRFKEQDLKREVLLRADFEFCSSDSPVKCDDPTEKTEGRNINFLMHLYPEETAAVPKK